MRCLCIDSGDMDVSVEDVDVRSDIDEDDYNFLYDAVAGVGPCLKFLGYPLTCSGRVSV